MASFNKVILMGNLTRDPELKYLPSNTPVCDFGLAVNRRWRDKDGNQKEDVCFIDVAAFGRQAETINQYMAKGKPILIEGHLRLESWTGQDGQKRSKHTVTVENFTFVGPREGGGQGGGGGAPYERSAAPAARPAGAMPAPTPRVVPPPVHEAPADTGFAEHEEPPRGEQIPF